MNPSTQEATFLSHLGCHSQNSFLRSGRTKHALYRPLGNFLSRVNKRTRGFYMQYARCASAQLRSCISHEDGMGKSQNRCCLPNQPD